MSGAVTAVPRVGRQQAASAERPRGAARPHVQAVRKFTGLFPPATAGITSRGRACHSCRHCRIRRYRVVVSGPPSGSDRAAGPRHDQSRVGITHDREGQAGPRRGPLLPDTGASVNRTSGRSGRRPASSPRRQWCPSGPTRHCGRNARRPHLEDHACTASAVGSIVMTTPASATASAAEPAGTAPASDNSAVTDADRSQTVVRRPAAASCVRSPSP